MMKNKEKNLNNNNKTKTKPKTPIYTYTHSHTKHIHVDIYDIKYRLYNITLGIYISKQNLLAAQFLSERYRM